MYCVRATLPSHNTFLWQTLNYFLKVNRTFNLSDLWGLPSWYLGLSVEKIFRYLATSLQVRVTSLYLNDHYTLYLTAMEYSRCLPTVTEKMCSL